MTTGITTLIEALDETAARCLKMHPGTIVRFVDIDADGVAGCSYAVNDGIDAGGNHYSAGARLSGCITPPSIAKTRKVNP